MLRGNLQQHFGGAAGWRQPCSQLCSVSSLMPRSLLGGIRTEHGRPARKFPPAHFLEQTGSTPELRVVAENRRTYETHRQRINPPRLLAKEWRQRNEGRGNRRHPLILSPIPLPPFLCQKSPARSRRGDEADRGADAAVRLFTSAATGLVLGPSLELYPLSFELCPRQC